MTDYCKGCFTRIVTIGYATVDCNHTPYNDDGKCPCTECIVKVICKYQCSTFIDFQTQCSDDTQKGC